MLIVGFETLPSRITGLPATDPSDGLVMSRSSPNSPFSPFSPASAGRVLRFSTRPLSRSHAGLLSEAELEVASGELAPGLRQVLHRHDSLVGADGFRKPARALATHRVFQRHQEFVNVAFDEQNVVWIRNLLNQPGEVIT